MIAFPSSVRVWLAVGRTDMRRGMNGLALQVQQSLGRDPHAGDLYVFKGYRQERTDGLALTGRMRDPQRRQLIGPCCLHPMIWSPPST